MQAMLSPVFLRQAIRLRWQQFLREVRSKDFSKSVTIMLGEALIAFIIALIVVALGANALVDLIWHRQLF